MSRMEGPPWGDARLNRLPTVFARKMKGDERMMDGKLELAQVIKALSEARDHYDDGNEVVSAIDEKIRQLLNLI